MRTIELSDAASSVTIVPERGAIATRFRVGARDVLYLDDATLSDRTKNVRGGVPVLFPSPGKLADDRFARDGKSGAMKQHGFARDVAWDVREASATRVVMALASSDATLAMYPWPFAATLAYVLAGATLRLDFSVTNTGTEAMPFAFGIHPYFLAGDKSRATIATRATRAFDNTTKKEIAFTGFDLTAKEVDLHLIDHGGTASELAWGDGARIAIRGSRDFGRWVVWTLAGRDFVCVEPWSAPADALNTGASLTVVAPGGAHAMWIEIELFA